MTNRSATKDETIGHLHDVILGLQDQNKRYREALQKIDDEIDGCAEGLDAEKELDRSKDIAYEALEGDSDESS